MSSTLVLTKTEVREPEDREPEEDVQPAREAELYEFDNCSKGLGIKICGGCSIDGEELYGVFVKRILPGGLADQEGGIEKGDQILEVNGDSLEGVTNERAVSILRQACASNHVEMVIARDELAIREFAEVLEKNNGFSFPCTPVPTDPQQKVIQDATRKSLSSSTSSTETAPLDHHNHVPQIQSSHATPANEAPSLPPLHEPVMNGGGVTPKLPWRGILPSMSSTPNRGSVNTTRTASSGSGFSSSLQLQGEPSPVGVAHLSHMLNSTGGSVFGGTSLGPGPGTRQGGQHHQPTLSQSRKLSLDPYVRLKVEKLNAALKYLGLEPSLEQEEEMRARLNIDQSGTVNYGDFVGVVRELFRAELEEKDIGPGAMMFAAGDITDLVEPPAFRPETNGGASGVSQHQLEQENEELRGENMRLQVLLKDKEDEILRIRKEAQGAITEQRTLRSKVHLAAEAQKAARDMEHDYEEVVHLLETEIAQLKLQLSRHGESDPIMQRRLAVLTCQLKKAESEKETYKVATEKLMQYAENVNEALSDSVATSRPLGVAGAKAAGFLGKHKRPTKSNKVIATESRDIIKSVRSLLDRQPLPFGWEETYTSDGMKYYINHLNQVTTWSHPLSHVTHLPTTTSVPIQQQDKKPKDEEPTASGSAG